MEQVSISELRSHLLKYLKKAQLGQNIMITSHGQLMATIIPPVDQRETAQAKLQTLAQTAIIGDVLAPINAEWDVMQ